MAEDYSAAALDKLKKQVAEKAIQRYLSELNWFGTAERGFQGSGYDKMLPPITGPTGTIQLKLSANGGGTSSAPAQPLPGSRIGELVSKGMGDTYYPYEVDPSG